jgi:hypothetical protein
MARSLRAAVVVVALTAGGLAAQGPAHADTGCVVTPLGASAPVFATTSTAAAQVGTITNSSPGRGCNRTAGSAYQICGGGTTWLYVRNKAGYTPLFCVDVAE